MAMAGSKIFWFIIRVVFFGAAYYFFQDRVTVSGVANASEEIQSKLGGTFHQAVQFLTRDYANESLGNKEKPSTFDRTVKGLTTSSFGLTVVLILVITVLYVSFSILYQQSKKY